MKNLFLLVFIFIFLISCNKEDDGIKVHTEILGDYKFVSYTSNIPLDLDFDNNKDINLLNEFDYYIDKGTRDAKLWETTYLHDFDFDYYISLTNFPRAWSTRIYYEERFSQNQDVVWLNLDKNINVLNINQEMTDFPEKGQYFYTTDVEFLANKNLKINGKQYFYDFETEEWVEVEIEAILEKM